MVIRILVAAGMTTVGRALVALLELEADFLVVSTPDRGDDIVPAAREHAAQVAVIDIDLPSLDGLDAAERLRELPECRTLVLTSLALPGTLRRALAAGALGYLLKDTPARELTTAIHRVARGQLVIDPQLGLAVRAGAQTPLDERETEVLRLAAEGARARDISLLLHLSAGTVRDCLSAIVGKLNARNSGDAVRIARDSGWLL